MASEVQVPTLRQVQGQLNQATTAMVAICGSGSSNSSESCSEDSGSEGCSSEGLGLSEGVGVEALPRDFVEKMTTLMGKPDNVRFMKGSYGFTSFTFDKPMEQTNKRNLAVLAHGIGARQDLTYPEQVIQTKLVEQGYTVIAYSYYGHGWSYASSEINPGGAGCLCGGAQYDQSIFCQQVKELVCHLLEPSEPIDLWIGHSTGGLLGPVVAESGTWPIRKFALISPAFWAKKATIAKNTDALHPVSTHLVSNSSLLMNLVVEEYSKLIEHAAAKETVARRLEIHPQLAEAILAINQCFLRGDLLPKHRECWQRLLKGCDAPKTLLLWGDHDVVVPFECAQEVVSWNPARVTLQPMVNFGHESIAEGPVAIASKIVSFFPKPGAE